MTTQASSRLLIWSLWAILCCAWGGLAQAQDRQPAPALDRPANLSPSRDLEANTLVLAVRLDGHTLSDGLTAYQDGVHVLLPLGELAHLLTLAISVEPSKGVASGFVVREDSGFALDAARQTVTTAGQSQTYAPQGVMVLGDDIYVSHLLLSRWLPVDLVVDLPTLQLRVTPRVRLPLQERLRREGMGIGTSTGHNRDATSAYPLVTSPVQLIDRPFVDQTFGSDARASTDKRQSRAAYTAYMTGDVLGMEGAAYVSRSSDKGRYDAHLTLSRHDPEGDLLGPLRARAVSVGHVSVPGVPYVMLGSASGQGLTVSNRPASQPSSFDRQTLRGDLPPGWDVTLYYNDALLAYQGASKDGQYMFDDLPLSFGANEFRLVFNGPLGQVRVERKSFTLDQAVVKPGELFYSLAQQRDEHGAQRSVALFDLGLTRSLAANVGVIRKPTTNPDLADGFVQLGLRHYGGAMIGSLQMVGSARGGAMAEAGVKTRFMGQAIELLHTHRLGGFDSEALPGGAQGLRYRDKLRTNGTWVSDLLPPMTVALDASQDVLAGGEKINSVGGRASTQFSGTAVTHSLRWSSGLGLQTAEGSLQLSRRVLDIGLSAQVDFAMKPGWRNQAMAVSADHSIFSGVRLNASLLHMATDGLTQLGMGLSKNLGRYAMGINAAYTNRRELSLGLQVFVGLGHDPGTGSWVPDAQPMASSGGVSARAFVDLNGNGLRDPGEALLPGVGFVVNQGGRHPRRTDDAGQAFIDRLPTGQYTDIAIDTSTLEDPQWRPSTPGLRVLPRPGHVDVVDFPVVSTSEVEGTVFLLSNDARKPIGNVRLELVNDAGEVLDTTTSASDGYYLLHQVSPGQVRVRVAPDQVAQLGLSGELFKALRIPTESDFIGGVDFELRLSGR
jgi:hypothetical protein